MYIAHVLHKSGSSVTGCYDNKHFEVHFFKAIKQSSLSILSLQVLLLATFKRVKFSVFGCPVIWYKMLRAFLQLTTFCLLFVQNILDLMNFERKKNKTVYGIGFLLEN